jgi:hypothetical protein
MDPTLRVARRAGAAAALTCVAALAAACGSSLSPTASGNAAAPAASSRTSPAVSSAASPPAPATSSPAPTGPGPCPTRSLQLKLGAGQGTAGSIYTVIDFTNVSNVTCTLYGYPGVSLTTGKPGAPIGQPAAENPATPRQLVTLQPATTGSALLRIVDAGNYPASRCHPVPSRYLKIYPPNQTAPVYLRYKTLGCAKPVRLLTVNVVKPGSGSGA